MSGNQAAAKVAQLARDMAAGYAAHITASRIAPRVDSDALVGFFAAYPTDCVPRKDGTPWTFSTQDALYDAIARETIAEEFPRIWLTGALLAVGDALKDNGHFDRAPELELLRRLAHDGQPVLFDFMEAGDVLDLLSSVALHLDRIGRGESP